MNIQTLTALCTWWSSLGTVCFMVDFFLVFYSFWLFSITQEIWAPFLPFVTSGCS